MDIPYVVDKRIIDELSDDDIRFITSFSPNVTKESARIDLISYNFIVFTDIFETFHKRYLDNDEIIRDDYYEEYDEEQLICYAYMCVITTLFLDLLKNIDDRISDMNSNNKKKFYDIYQYYYISCVCTYLTQLTNLLENNNNIYTSRPKYSYLFELFTPISACASSLWYSYKPKKIIRASNITGYPTWEKNSCYADAIMTALFYSNDFFDELIIGDNKNRKDSVGISYFKRMFSGVTELSRRVIDNYCQLLAYEKPKLNGNIQSLIKKFIVNIRKNENEKHDQYSLEPINSIIRRRIGTQITTGDPDEYMNIILEEVNLKREREMIFKIFKLKNFIEDDVRINAFRGNLIRLDIKGEYIERNIKLSEVIFQYIQKGFHEPEDFNSTSYKINIHRKKKEFQHETEIQIITNENTGRDEMTSVGTTHLTQSYQLLSLPPILCISFDNNYYQMVNKKATIEIDNITEVKKKKYNPSLYTLFDSIGRKYVYELYSIVCYSSGHYFSFVYSRNHWYKVDIINMNQDNKLQPINITSMRTYMRVGYNMNVLGCVILKRIK